MADVARIVIECEPKAPDGFEYRVWTEHNGQAFGELRSHLFAEAIAELMDKTARGDLNPYEPVFE